ncbi:MAG: hypothetical protein M1823_002517 [Watsoniomyces obsoletus]|nr:MAG: hypothetical protein M1823_002517 [Watsoniomyces obsoletus]
MISKLVGVIALLQFFNVVHAHGTVYAMSVNDVLIPKSVWEIKWHYFPNENNYMEPWEINDEAIICHKNTDQGPDHQSVRGGDKITINYQWPEDHSHPGPVMIYMANCGGPCDKVQRTNLEFVKVQEMGLLQSKPKRWATDVLIERGDAWDFIIPREFIPGYWLLRMEIIALQFSTKQWYMSCLNLNVTESSGTRNPKGMKATEFYDQKDPRWTQDVTNTDHVDSWPVPGPPLLQYNELKENQEINFRNVQFASSSIMAVLSSQPTPVKPVATSVEGYDRAVNVGASPTPTSKEVENGGSGAAAAAGGSVGSVNETPTTPQSTPTPTPTPTPNAGENGNGGNQYDNQKDVKKEDDGQKEVELVNSSNGNEEECKKPEVVTITTTTTTTMAAQPSGGNQVDLVNGSNGNEECKPSPPVTVTTTMTFTATVTPQASRDSKGFQGGY